ncbi:MAG: P-loop NTPase fold protein, partial [Candidatus Nitrosopolaris sp.]
MPQIKKIDAEDKENHQEAKSIKNDDDDNDDSNPKTSTIKIITDDPTLEDALDFDSYSKQLADIIRNSAPRFAIGVFGGWGTGKTSLMKMIEANLLKGNYVFKWEHIPNYSSDNNNLKHHLMENFPDLEWIETKEFMKSPDGKTIEIHDDSNNFLSISIDNKTIFASMLINGKPFNNIFIIKKEGDNDGSELNVYKREKDILTVWFNAWKYENEKYLAVVPFLRTIKITLDNDKDSKIGKRWDNVRQALENTFRAFIDSTNISLGMGSYGSTQINLSKFADVLKADGSAKVSGESVYYHKHVTDYLEDSLSKLRENNSNRRIVVFIDDLDRCHPKQALEVLDSIKTFFDIEGLIYVIGMDSGSINSIIEEKYGGKDSDIKVKKGLDYLQKIVQLPFQIPTWKGID